jgi:hypothetical protein
MIHLRSATSLEATKRLVGIVVVMLSSAVVLAPIPLTSVVPAMVITLISLAYLEEDGLPPLDRSASGRHGASGRSSGGLGDGPR